LRVVSQQANRLQNDAFLENAVGVDVLQVCSSGSSGSSATAANEDKEIVHFCFFFCGKKN
jgi:hypothetical protein